MQLAVLQGPCNGLAWRALGIMSYLYSSSSNNNNYAAAAALEQGAGGGGFTHSPIYCLTKAIELSGGIDFDAWLLKGQLLMSSRKHKEARVCFQHAFTLHAGSPVLLASYGLCLSALGFVSPPGKKHDEYLARFDKMSSLCELATSEDPEELFKASVIIGLDETVKARAASRRGGRVGTNTNTSASTSASPADNNSNNYRDVPPDVLYWYGMFHIQRGTSKAHVKAKALFTRAVQRSDCSPHPLALYMLGWLAELNMDLKIAEKYYCYALQLEPIDPSYFLRLTQLANDTHAFVQGLLANAEKAESTRKRAIKKKNALRRKGISVPVGKDGETDKSQEVANMRKRVLLHERVIRLSLLRTEQLGPQLRGLCVPGKFVHIEPFWLERLLHAFSACDDWANLLRSSRDYTVGTVEGEGGGGALRHPNHGSLSPSKSKAHK